MYGVDITGNVSILVVDDEESIREVLDEFLTLKKFKVKTAASGYEALAILAEEVFDILLLDIKMPGMDGIQLLQEVRNRNINSIVIMMTAFGTVETAAKAFKLNTFEYILKPFNSDLIYNTIVNAIQKRNLELENVYLKTTVSLFDVAQAVEDNSSTDTLVTKLGNALLQETGANVVSVYLASKNNQRFKLYDTFFAPDFDETEMGVLDEERVADVIRENEDILSTNPAARIFFSRVPSRTLHSLMVIPLKHGSSLLGFVVFYSFNPRLIFTLGLKRFMKVFASYFSTSIENARLYQDMMENFNQTIQSFAHAIEAKDKYTQGHSERVTMYAVALAREMKLSDFEIDVIFRAGRLHDIGKIGLQYEKLNKPGKLTDEEWEMFRKHPTIGRKILLPIRFLQSVVPLVYHHHERWDGKGYPEALKGREIPLGARVLAIADTYDAMTSDRSYRRALSHLHAIEELQKCINSQFDPELVPLFVPALNRYRQKCVEMGIDVPE